MSRNVLHTLVLSVWIILVACQSQYPLHREPVKFVAQVEPQSEEWPRSSPEEQGMNGELIAQLRERLMKHAPAVRSVLVARSGMLVFEYYGQGVGRDDLQRVNSVTKSFTSALVGIALEHGYIDNLEQPLSQFFPEVLAPDVDPRVRRLTIANLLSMTAGFKWDEEHDDGVRIRSINSVNYAIHRSIVQACGTHFSYDSYSSHLSSVLISRVTGSATTAFADTNLFLPLGISEYRWEKDSEGNNWGGFGLYLRARDLAKFGQLYLDKGAWQGRQLISADFIETSTRPHTTGGWPAAVGYGYHWWTPDAATTPRVFFALGYGGQAIVVYPTLNIVVVVTQNQEIATDIRWITREFVIPSVVSTRH